MNNQLISSEQFPVSKLALRWLVVDYRCFIVLSILI